MGSIPVGGSETEFRDRSTYASDTVCYTFWMDDNAMLREMYRLTQDNNRMLHSMRRTAFFGGLLKVIVWIVVLVTPIWFYMTYLAPIADSVQKTVSEAQGTSVEAQAQIKQLQDSLKKVQESLKLPALPTGLSFPRLSTTSPQ